MAQFPARPCDAPVGQPAVAQLPWAHDVILAGDAARGALTDRFKRDHVVTSINIQLEDLKLSLFKQRGGLGKAHQLFGNDLNRILEELNLALVA